MAREMKETLLDLITKHNQLYKFTTRGNLKTNGRRVKKGRTKARTRKMKRMQVNIDKILSSISPSYRSGGVVTDLDLNEVQLLQLRQFNNNNNNNNNFISIALLSYVQGALQSCKQHY